METLDRLYQNAQILFWEGVDFVSAYLLQAELWLRRPLGQMGFSSRIQVFCLLVLCFVAVLLALRAFGGLVRTAMLVLAAALFVHLITTQVHLT